VTLAISHGESHARARAALRACQQAPKLSRALRHAPERRLLQLSATLRDQLVEIRVADQGVGIAPELREKILQQVTPSASKTSRILVVDDDANAPRHAQRAAAERSASQRSS
jgi:hypothetical protein